jgi:ankyrin repeat protein
VIAHHRDTEIVERLRSAGAALEQTPQALGSLVLSAAQEGNLELLEYLLDNGVDINVPNAWGLTPLMAAAERGHAQVVSRCLEACADVHAADENGRTALFYAAAPEAFTAFQLAQEFGSDAQNALLKSCLPDMPDGVTLPPLDFGYQPSDDVTCIDLLIRAGADIDSRDVDGATPLLVACRCGRPSRVVRLLELGADAAATDNQGRTAQASAAEHHDPQQCEQILALLLSRDN